MNNRSIIAKCGVQVGENNRNPLNPVVEIVLEIRDTGQDKTLVNRAIIPMESFDYWELALDKAVEDLKEYIKANPFT